MEKVVWQSRSPVVAEAVRSRALPDSANGGNAYDFHAFMALTNSFNMKIDEAAVKQKSDSFLSYWWRMTNHQPAADIIIAEPSPVVFGKRNNKSRTVAMIHHVDDDLAGSSLKHSWFFGRLKKKLQEVDLVITVSAFWEDYLRSIGCSGIKRIYNSFNPSEYVIGENEVAGFRKKYGIQNDLPLIYIGNAHKQKGAPEVYAALKNKDYQFVMTGKENHLPELPVKFLSLSRHDYILLLKASDVVVTFSKMTEGWNRIAHEAMLCGTPVIGSGKGGMKELLEGGKQTIVSDASALADAVERVLSEKSRYAQSGLNYVKQFDMQYFQHAWISAIRELTGK